MPDRSFNGRDFVLAPGEMLFLYTDGVTEAPNRAGDLFNTQRLLDIARQFGRLSPQELMLSVIDNVERFWQEPSRPTTSLALSSAATRRSSAYPSQCLATPVFASSSAAHSLSLSSATSGKPP